MTRKLFIAKKRRSRKAEALARLRQRWELEHEDEEWEAEKEPSVTPMFEALEGGIKGVIEALRCHDDDDAKAFIDEYDLLSQTDKALVPLEYVAFGAGLSSLRLAEISQTAVFLYGQIKTKMLLASGIPVIVAKSIKMAKMTKGLYDREMMLKAGGVLPVPKGAKIAIQNNYAKPEEEEKPAKAPAWREAEDRLREFHDLTEPKRLPSPVEAPISIGGHIDRMQAETVEILRGE